MSLPRLSAFDPEQKSEGSIDPLGLVPIADRLSVRLVPGVRERMSHPRFLSLISAGAALCLEFPQDRIASDGISSPLQVYEWYVVQALVKTYKESGGLVGLPGSEKANNALKKNLPLNAPRYLRVPSVFGFYGVYKTLARDMEIIQGDRLAENGDKLVRIWEKEQNLQGFYSSMTGPGANFKSKLKSAIEDGLKKGQVERMWSWSFFQDLAQCMHPIKAGRKEAQTIFDLLRNDKEQKRKEIIDALISYIDKYDVTDGISESHFHSFLLKQVRQEIRELIEAIRTYELFSRTLTNALESVLYKLSNQANKGSMNDIENLAPVKYAAEYISGQYVDCIAALTKVKEDNSMQKTFGRFSNSFGPRDFAENLIEHHHEIQKRKPPFGKVPWLEKYENKKLILRPAYTRLNNLASSDPKEYVYFYRTNSLLSFLKDLRKLNG